MLNLCKTVNEPALCTPLKCELLPSQSPLLPWNNATQRKKIVAGVGVWRWADWREEEGLRKEERDMTADLCGGGAPLNQQKNLRNRFIYFVPPTAQQQNFSLHA